MGKALILPIKRKWFDMIRQGIKLEEYREIKSYYDVRLCNLFGAIWVGDQHLQGEYVPEEIRKEQEQEIWFRNGYGKNSPMIKTICTLSVGEGRQEWGAEHGKRYYILKINTVEERRK